MYKTPYTITIECTEKTSKYPTLKTSKRIAIFLQYHVIALIIKYCVKTV